MEPDGLFSLTAAGRRAPRRGRCRPTGSPPRPPTRRCRSGCARPRLDELVGQDHLLAPGAPLRQLVTGATPMSVILWGPPGTGKTTIAHLVAAATDRRFVAMSALSAGVKDVRAVIDTARRERRAGGPPTVLFIDEVHRFSKTQQDSLLAAVEDRTVTLLAATTENPYFSVISPLLSRCVLLTLQPLDDDDGARAGAPRGRRRARPGRRGHAHRGGRGASGTPGGRRRPQGADRAGGGRRRRPRPRASTEIDLATAEKAVDVAAVRYDRDGDAHYDVTSAFIKSMRGSRPGRGAALAGPDAGRRRGPAVHRPADRDLRQRGRRHGRPAGAAGRDRGRAGGASTSACPRRSSTWPRRSSTWPPRPKSNSVTTALGAAMADVRAGRGGAVPPPSARRALPRLTWSWSRPRLPLPARRPAWCGHPAVRPG